MCRDSADWLSRFFFHGWFFLLLCCVSINSFSQNITDSRQIVVQLKWYHQFQFAGFYAALEQGFYREAGLDVLLKQGIPGIDINEELYSGRAQYLVNSPIGLLERMQGKPIVVLAAIFQHSPLIIISGKNSGIQVPSDLIGRRVMLIDDMDLEIFSMLVKEGVSLDALVRVDHSWDLADLMENRVDAMSAYIMDAPFILEQSGYEYNVIHPINYGIDFYGDCIYTTDEEIQQNPDQVQAFLEATLRGWEYAMEHPLEIVALLLQKYNVQLSHERLLYEADFMEKLILPKFIKIGHMNPGRWKHIADMFVALGMVEPDYSLNGFLYEPPLKSQWGRRLLMEVSAGLVVVFLVIVLLLAVNRRLQIKVEARTRELYANNKRLQKEIEERMHIEMRLRESESRLRAVFQAAESVAFITTNLGGEDSRVLTFSPGAERIFGYTEDEIIGKPVAVLHRPEDVVHFEPMQKKLEQGEKGYSGETVLVRKSGEEFAVLFTLHPLRDSDGRIIGTLGVSLDISHLKQVEDELLRSRKLESLGILAGGIAHDFNNLLTAILGNISLAKQRVDSVDPLIALLADAEKASIQAQKLTQQLLTFSKGGAPVKEIVAIQNIVQETAVFTLRGSSVKCRFSFSDNLPNLEVDKGQLSQVIQNLVMNAEQAMPMGGIIDIHIEQRVIHDEGELIKPGDYVVIQIKDEGVGIQEDVLEKIFDPYFTTKQQGNGLGLSTSYSIIQKHGGRIHVASAVGQGSVFSIYLPAIKDGVSHTLPFESEIDSVPLRGRVLVMDDEALIQDVAGKMLETFGLDVVLTSDGAEAIQRYKELKSSGETVDVVIMDLTVPGGMGGREAVRGILDFDPGAKVIVSSGYSGDPIMSNPRVYGFCGVIVKPYTIETLHRTMVEVLNEGKDEYHD
jgi:two-component system, cell cycle sensor histidine kinase and response regulator CckA